MKRHGSIKSSGRKFAVFFLFLCLLQTQSEAYSVLTHEAIVDLAWDSHIKPLLLAKYPSTTPEQLLEAHAYAYGGCVIQDMGYYPFGNKQFSDLLHYVRSGDFVANMLKDAHDVNELAFALGALSHYVADIGGHPAVNRAVPMEFPNLQHKYGNLVTYEENPRDHIRTEFGFDVSQVAKNRYAPEAYHDFIGFKVATPLLELAFRETYGMELRTIYPNLDRSVNSFRHDISVMIPRLTRVALLTKNNADVKEKQDRAQRRFVYRLSKADYQKEWGKDYSKPSIGTRILAGLYWLIPKIGPLKVIDFRVPSTATEDLYLKSVDETIHHYETELQAADTRLDNMSLPNMNLDTAWKTLPGQYKLADRAYANLVHTMAEHKFQGLTPDLKDDIAAFYADPNAPLDTRKHLKKWQRLQNELAELKNVNPGEQPVAFNNDCPKCP